MGQRLQIIATLFALIGQFALRKTLYEETIFSSKKD